MSDTEPTVTAWSTRALGSQFGIPDTTLGHWIKVGLLTPDTRGRGRRGHAIGITGLLEICMITQLRQANFSLQKIRKAVEHLRMISGEDRPLARLTLVCHGNHDIEWKPNGIEDELTISALRRPGQVMLVFPIGEQFTDLLRQMGYTGPVTLQPMPQELVTA